MRNWDFCRHAQDKLNMRNEVAKIFLEKDR